MGRLDIPQYRPKHSESEMLYDLFSGGHRPSPVIELRRPRRFIGIEVLRKIPNANKLPICVLTGSTAARDLFRREFGIQTYLNNPVSRASLIGCFRCYDHLRPIAEELLRA